jgi:hypothetical protein
MTSYLKNSASSNYNNYSNNNLLNSYKSEFNDIQNISSKNSVTESWHKKQFNKVKNFGSTITDKAGSQGKNITYKIQNMVNSDNGSKVINITLVGFIVLLIGVYAFFYKKMGPNIKLASKYAIISVLSLLVSMYGVNRVFSSTSNYGKIVSIIFVAIFAYCLVMAIVNLMDYYRFKKINEPWIIEGNKNAKDSYVLTQDPNNPGSVILYRSDNEANGIEFSYSLWMIIQDYNYNREGEYKHIFHKGDKTGKVTFSPKMVLLNDSNTLRVTMNLIDGTDSPPIDVNNIPIDKWLHVSLIVKQKKVEIYINGFLKKVSVLKAIPRQNFNALWINLNGGFEGYISKFQYHRRALTFDEVESFVKKGPSKSSCMVSGVKPPYLDSGWWLDRDRDSSS